MSTGKRGGGPRRRPMRRHRCHPGAPPRTCRPRRLSPLTHSRSAARGRPLRPSRGPSITSLTTSQLRLSATLSGGTLAGGTRLPRWRVDAIRSRECAGRPTPDLTQNRVSDQQAKREPDGAVSVEESNECGGTPTRPCCARTRPFGDDSGCLRDAARPRARPWCLLEGGKEAYDVSRGCVCVSGSLGYRTASELTLCAPGVLR